MFMERMQTRAWKSLGDVAGEYTMNQAFWVEAAERDVVGMLEAY